MTNIADFYDIVQNNLIAEKKPIVPHSFLDKKTNFDVDAHIHSKFSTDGYMEPYQIAQRCYDNGVRFASITDHNSFEAIKQLRQQDRKNAKYTYLNYDGVKIFTGTEISCRMYLNKNKSAYLKLHMLCYGFDIENNNSPLIQMISEKEYDYTSSRYFPLYYLSSFDPIKYACDLKDFKDFCVEKINRKSFTGRINAKEAIDYYTWKGISEKEILADFAKFSEVKDSINIDVVDLIKETHKCGGYCVVAHPISNLERFRNNFYKDYNDFQFAKNLTEKLLSAGCDGLEIANKDDALCRKYNDAFKDVFLHSCGTDTHYYDFDNFHDIGRYNTIDVTNENFTMRMLELEKAKSKRTLTQRQKLYDKNTIHNTNINIDKTFNNKNKNKGKHNHKSYYYSYNQ